jgi:formate hydrogenlyase transcriptional activator
MSEPGASSYAVMRDPSTIDAEALCRLAVECLPNGVLILNPDGTIRAANRQIVRQFGYVREELLGQPVDALLPDGLKTLGHVSRAHFLLTPAAAVDTEWFGRHADGSTFAVDVSLKPIETTQGPFVVASIVDVAARQRQAARGRLTVEGQLEFERLVAELSSHFINVPFDQVDEAIRVALRRIGEALSLDRCGFVQMAADRTVTSSLSWARPDVPVLPTPIDGAARFPWCTARLQAGEVICFSRLEEIPSEIDRESCRAIGARSSVSIPLSVAGKVVGSVAFTMTRCERAWLPEELHRLRILGGAFAGVLARRQGDAALHGMISEMEQLREQLQAENASLRREARAHTGASPIVGQSGAIRRVLDQIEQVAKTDSTVLLLGETGTGKELFATQIHMLSQRRERTMVRVNCSAIPSTLMESELFGRERGAFTGALTRQIGRFELADRSSIFLDEIGDLTPDVQVKLLRVLEERQIERLGSPKAIQIDTRIIAATHRDLERHIGEGTFREDLYYRLNVFPIQVPPLRERVEDIPLLVWRFVDEFSRAFGKRIESIPPDNLAALQRYPWPGNIRELRNVVERAMIVVSGPRLTIGLPAASRGAEKHSTRLSDVERKHIRTVLESTGWRIRGTGGAAERLGLRPTTLETRIAKLGLSRPKPA